jgi:hypothetical protein
VIAQQKQRSPPRVPRHHLHALNATDCTRRRCGRVEAARASRHRAQRRRWQYGVRALLLLLLFRTRRWRAVIAHNEYSSQS